MKEIERMNAWKWKYIESLYKNYTIEHDHFKLSSPLVEKEKYYR